MTLSRNPRCAFPPHPGPGGDGELPPVAASSALSRFRGWLRHAPAERLPLLGIPGIWAATEILHAAGVPGLYAGAAAAVTTGAAGWLGEHRSKNTRHKRMGGAEVAAATGAVGAWATAATAFGPLAGPDHLLSLAYAAGCGAGYWWLRRHEAIRAARARRQAAAEWEAKKATWHRLAPLLGLHGSHLLEHEDTLLGDTLLIDTRGTGKRASQISARDVAERLGEIEMIPIGRIDVTTDRIPGRLRITVRRKDPWAQPLTHPAIDRASPFARHVPEPATCRTPLVIGADPETGQPLTLTVWDADEGGKVILVAAKKGSGKTVLLNCISERITACTDAQLIQVNLGKHREDLRWAPLAAANALGRDQTGQARRILQWVLNAIEERGKTGDEARITPTPDTPLLAVKIDEVDQVAADPVCRELLRLIASKCRSEAVALIVAGQRATAQWVGGADLRANIDIAILGRFARRGEARKATGEEIDLPDMGEYGEGRPGVFLITELGGGGGYERGRVFNLSDPASIDAIVARRAASRAPYTPEPALAPLAGQWAKITSGATGDEDQDDEAATLPAAAGAGQVLAGTGPIRAKIDAARHAAAAGIDIPDVPAEVAARVAAERQRQALQQNFGDVTIPGPAASALLSLLAAPDGTTSSQAAEVIGKSKPVAHRYLSALRASGVARLDGSGRGARFRLAGDGEGQRPSLSLVPPPDDTRDGNQDDTAAG